MIRNKILKILRSIGGFEGLGAIKKWVPPLILLILAFGVMAANANYLWQTGALPFGPDAPTDIGQAKALLAGESLSTYRSPGAWLFYYLIMRFAGENYRLFSWIQVVLAAFIPVLVYIISLRVFKSRLVGLTAAGLTIFSPILLYTNLWVGKEFLQVLFILLFLAVFIYASQKSSLGWLVGAGLLMGYLLLIKAVFIPVFLVAIFLIFLKFKGKNRFLWPLVFFLAAAIVVSPWTIRNYRSGQPVLISSEGEASLNLGLHPFSTGTGTYPTEQETLILYEVLGDKPTPGMGGAALKLARFYWHHPRELIGKVVSKMTMLVKWESTRGVDTVLKINVDSQPRRFFDAFSLLLSIFAILWYLIKHRFRPSSRFIILASFPLLLLVIHSFFTMETRYFAAVLPIVYILTVYLLIEVGGWAKSKSTIYFFIYLVFLPILFWTGYKTYQWFEDYTTRNFYYSFDEGNSYLEAFVIRNDKGDFSKVSEKGMVSLSDAVPNLDFILGFKYNFPLVSLMVRDTHITESDGLTALEFSLDEKNWIPIFEDKPRLTEKKETDYWRWYAKDNQAISKSFFLRYYLERGSGVERTANISNLDIWVNVAPIIPTDFLHDMLEEPRGYKVFWATPTWQRQHKKIIISE